MPEKDPALWSITTWALAIGVGMAGGAISFINKPVRGSLTTLFCEIFTSGFVSLMVFMLLNSNNFDPGLSASISGVCGHMATRLLFSVEKAIERKIDSLGLDE
jgi:hypothetical protein